MNKKSETISSFLLKGKILRRMGVLFASAVISSSVFAQVTVSVKQQTIKQALRSIEQVSDYRFFYSNQLPDLDKKVTFEVNDQSIEAAMNKLLNGTGLVYEKRENNQIYLGVKGGEEKGKEKKITGTIVDDKGEPVIGANVSIKGTTSGSITDIDGHFSLEAKSGETLFISYVGYETQEIMIGNPSVYNIKLSEDTQALEEVVVIGYGTQNKQAITGSISKAKLETYNIVPTNNVLETIKGSMPGVNIGGTNTAGSTPSFSIRGQNSTRNTAEDNGNQPLVVVDGAIFNGSLSDIPSDDIESFTVLKDASAAAVYGSRSANGVILIQTKRGRSKDGKPTFNVNLSYGISNEMERLKIYDSPGYLKRMLDIRSLNGMEADPNKIPYYLEVEEKKNYEATADHRPTVEDPYDQFRQNAYDLKANISISNSSDLASYYISANMTDQKGVMMNDRYKNFSGRINIDTHLTDWLKIGVKSNYSIRDYSGSAPSMEQATHFSPFASIYDENGNYLQFPQTTTSFQSPYWSMHTSDTEKYNNLGAILDATITIPWVKGLSYSMVYSNNLRWSQKYYFDNEFTTEGLGKNGKGERKLNNDYNMLLDNMIKYNNTFGGKHNVDVTLLYSRERSTWEETKGYGENFDNTVLGDNKLEDAKKQTVNTGSGESGAIGWMGRATYTFDNRYSITGTVRRDGYSGFSVNKKWGTFASAGVNWNISREAFMKQVSFVDNLALRLSYGSNGNQSISPYSTLAKVGTDKYIFAGDPSYSITQYISSFALNNLGWETTTGFNFGLDFAVLDNRLSGSVDAYSTSTKDLLFNLALPSISGKKEMLSNIGKIKNKGVEINLHSVNIQNKDFSWTSDFAFSLNRNKVATIYGDDNNGDGIEDDLISSGYFIGKSLGTIYAYNVNGMWQQSDVDNGTIMEGMRPGDYKLEDVDGDGTISSDKDRQFMGNSNPNFRWSFTNTLNYKDFSLMLYFNSVWGGNGYYLSNNNTPYNDGYANNPNINHPVYDYWTPENTGAKYPRPDYKVSAYQGVKYIDRSFIKLQKVALSYNLTRFVKPVGLDNMVLSVSADNLFTFAPHWDGLDPETDQGVRDNAIPSIRTYQMTLMFNF